MLGLVEQDLRSAYAIADKMARHKAVDAAKAKVMAHYLPGRRRSRPTTSCASAACSRSSKPRSCAGTSSTPASASTAATSRPCARSCAEVGVLPRAHGSALFTRGETQALVVATLGTGEDEQWIDALQGTYKETFLLHYNFPPFSVGETGRMGGTKPARDRPRQARLARDPSGAAGEARVPLHDPRRLGDHRVERLVLDGDRVRHLARADGRGRAAQAADRRHRDGPHPGGQALRGALRHPRRRGSSRRHGLQGGRHRAAASPRCRWTSRSPASPKRS